MCGKVPGVLRGGVWTGETRIWAQRGKGVLQAGRLDWGGSGDNKERHLLQEAWGAPEDWSAEREVTRQAVGEGLRQGYTDWLMVIQLSSDTGTAITVAVGTERQ